VLFDLGRIDLRGEDVLFPAAGAQIGREAANVVGQVIEIAVIGFARAGVAENPAVVRHKQVAVGKPGEVDGLPLVFSERRRDVPDRLPAFEKGAAENCL
jgi:hypothetical protein